MKNVFIFLLFAGSISAQAEIIDGIYYNLNSNAQTAEVVYHRGYFYKGDMVIPSSVTHEDVNYSVTAISPNAFRGSSELTSVTIPSSVTSIGDGLFNGCTSLSSIIIEEGNSKYDSRDNCNAIIETASNTLLFGCGISTIPNSVTNIGNSAFSECTALTSLNIPDNVTTIGEKAFYGCSGLTSITIGNGVTTIGKEVFKDCSNLTTVGINNNTLVSKNNHSASPTPITSIFGTQVKEYVLGEDVTSIGSNTFLDCYNLTSVQMSNSVTSIGESAFAYCNKLTTVRMSDNITSIGNLAFFQCYNLTSITIPSGVTDLELWTFDGCGSITKVVLNSNAFVSKDFYSTSSLARYFGNQVKEYVLGEEITSIGDNTFYGCSLLTSVNIPNNVTSIGENAFTGCHNLTSINVPNSVKSIGSHAFENCSGLTTIQVESGNTVYDSREHCNAIIETASNTLLWGCQNTMIPNSVAAIGDNAFYNCGLTSINIPNSVTSIGNSAFAGCTDLTSISISNSVTTIGQYAFSDCKSLASATIPNSVTAIGDYAFFGCSGLIAVDIPKSVTRIGYRAFNGCYGLAAIQVESGNTVYDSRENCNAIIETTSNTLLFGCQNTVVTNSVTGIGECAFWNCSGLTAITIPNSVTSIGRNAFTLCTNITSISIPNSVTTIEYCSFADCQNLATVILPNSVKKIGEGAFLRCSHLTDMYLYAEQVPESGDNIFGYSNYNATLHVPAGSLEAYSSAEQWKDFKEIVALTDDDPIPSGIKRICSNVMNSERYYSLDGKHTATPQRGLNIIRMSDGTTKKVVMK